METDLTVAERGQCDMKGQMVAFLSFIKRHKEKIACQQTTKNAALNIASKWKERQWHKAYVYTTFNEYRVI